MKVTITNLDSGNLPVYAPERRALIGAGWPGFAKSTLGNTPLLVDDADAWVVNIGDNPSFVDELKEGLNAVKDAVIKLVGAWRSQVRPEAPELQEPDVNVRLHNHGPNAIRVLKGSNLNEYHLPVGSTVDLGSVRYVELRELGV